jgi:hypothetical protein
MVQVILATEEDLVVARLKGNRLALGDPALWFLVTNAVLKQANYPKPSDAMIEELKRQFRMK